MEPAAPASAATEVHPDSRPAAAVEATADDQHTARAPGRPAADAEEPRIRTAPQPVPLAAAAPDKEFTIPGHFVLLSLGSHVFVGKGSDGLDPGLRAAVLVGGRVAPTFSAGAEFVIDYLNPATPTGTSVTEMMFDLTFSPLFHAPLGRNAQFVIGPRLGLFYLDFSGSSQLTAIDGWSWGWVAGANMGVLGPLGGAQAGFLFSLGARSPDKLCFTVSGQDEQCTSDGLNTAKVVAISALLML